MGYQDNIRKKIMAEGMEKTPEYAKKKADDYKKSANINYRLYKTAATKEEAQSRYKDSQNAYAKAEAWTEVLAAILQKLSGK